MGGSGAARGRPHRLPASGASRSPYDIDIMQTNRIRSSNVIHPLNTTISSRSAFSPVFVAAYIRDLPAAPQVPQAVSENSMLLYAQVFDHNSGFKAIADFDGSGRTSALAVSRSAAFGDLITDIAAQQVLSRVARIRRAAERHRPRRILALALNPAPCRVLGRGGRAESDPGRAEDDP